MPKEFSVEMIKQNVSEEEMINIIRERVDYLLEYDIDLLMSYLYRLDVEEKDINAVLQLNATLPANQGIARLIYKRQKKRIETKKRYQQDPIEGWDY